MTSGHYCGKGDCHAPSKIDFIRQQGFTTDGCQDGLYSALMFQPRVIAGVIISVVILQSPWVPLALSTVLWWSALVPSHNPFKTLIVQRGDGGSEAASRHACGAPAEAILTGHGRHHCDEHRHGTLRRSAARSLAARGRVPRRVDECRRPPILPPGLRLPSVAVSDSSHALSIAVGARVDLERIR